MLVRLFVFFGSLIVLALCAALIGPYFVDWTSYRADFEREASAILGRRVEVRGDVSARLLPFPSVVFSDVVVSGNHGEPAMTAESFSMDAELAPFLSGQVLIFDMRLARPKAEIAIGANGAVDWAMSPAAPVDPGHISIENLTVIEGALTVRDAATGRSVAVNEFNANVSARSLKGPWRVDGSMRVNGRRTTLTAASGVADGSGGMSLSLGFGPEVYPLKVESDGVATNAGGVLRYAGKFRAVGVPTVQTQLRGSDGKAPAPAQQTPHNRASGTFQLSHSRLDIDDFRFESGPLDDPYSAEGKAFLDLGAKPGFLVEATGQQFRVEDEKNIANGGMSLGERLADIEDTLALVPEPGIPGSVNIKLPAVVAGATTIRDLALSARPEGKGWRILSASAQLPGRSTLEADGYLTGGEAPHFDGSLLLAVRQPTGFAAWLSRDIEDSVRALPAAGFRSSVSLDREKQTFSDMELILGPTRLTGSVERSSAESAKPVIVARLAGETIDANTGAAFVALLGQDTVRQHDLDLALKAKSLAVGNVSIGAVDAAARLSGQRLDIDRLSIGDLAGASVAATGSLRDMDKEPIGNIDMTVTGDDLAPLSAQIARWLPDSLIATEIARRAATNPGLLSNARIDVMGSASGEPGMKLPSQMALSVSGKAGGSTVQGSITGTKADRMNAAALEAQLEFANEDATSLLALAGLPTLPVISLGPGKLSASVEQQGADAYATHVALEGDDFRLAFDGVTGAAREADGQAPFHAAGKVTLAAQDVEPWLLAVGTPLPGMGFGSAAELQADLDFRRPALSLTAIEGTIGESAAAGDVKVDFSGARPHMSGKLALDVLDLEPFAAVLFGAPALASADGLAWPAEKFVESAAMPASADLTLNVGALGVGILPDVHDATLSLKMDERRLEVADLQAKTAEGSLSGRVELTNEKGAGLLGAQLKLGDADLAMLLPRLGMAAPDLRGRADVAVNLAASGRSVETMMAGLSGSGTVDLKGVTVARLNAAALPALLKQADALGQTIDEAKTASFAPAILRDGDFVAGDGRFAFNLASGVLRMPPLTFDREKAALTVEGRVDIPAQTVEGSADLALKPGDEALVGAEPTVHFSVTGPAAEPQVVMDTNGLAQFLTQRQLEIEQARVEAMQAAIMEKQRLRREAAFFTALQTYRRALNQTETLRRIDLKRQFGEAEQRRLKQEAEDAAKAEKARLEAEKAAAEKPAPAASPKPGAKPASRQPASPAPNDNLTIGEFPPPPAAKPPGSFGESDFDD